MTIQDTAIAEALPSSTVVLARDGAEGPELLLVLRHGKASFANSYVFPGGLVEPQDYDVTARCVGRTEAEAGRLLGVGNGALAYYSAAIRELFEEAGILLARDPAGRWVDSGALASYRSGLHGGTTNWGEFLERYDLWLACDALRYFAFWITPREVRRRFSTRFFAAATPAGQEASHCGIELTDSRWMTANAAIEASREPDFQLPHPTRVSLETLGALDSVGSMLDWAARQGEQGVRCNLPAVVSVAGKPTVVMPDDHLYPQYRDEGEQS